LRQGLNKVIRKFFGLFFLSVSFVLCVYSQTNRDSFLEDLFKKGRISKHLYFRERSVKGIAESIAKLRQELRYKFILDFLIDQERAGKEGTDTIQFYDPEAIAYHKDVKLPEGALEQFEFGMYNTLYRVKSMTGDQQYFLLVCSETHDPCKSVLAFTLLSVDTVNGHLLDSFEVSDRSGGGTFQFDTLNNCNILRIERPQWSTGHYHEDEALLGISEENISVLYSRKKVEIFSPWNDLGEERRVLKERHLQDLNHDGFLDIIEQTTDEIMERPETDPRGKPDYYHAKVKKVLSKSTEKYFWNNGTHSFITGTEM
jgi:hypothetical protein